MVGRYLCGITGVQGVGKTTLVRAFEASGLGRSVTKRSLLPWRMNSAEGLDYYLEEYRRQNARIGNHGSCGTYLTDRLGVFDVLVYGEALRKLGRMSKSDCSRLSARSLEVWHRWLVPETAIFLHSSLDEIRTRLTRKSQDGLNYLDDASFIEASWDTYDALFLAFRDGAVGNSWSDTMAQAVRILESLPHLRLLNVCHLSKDQAFAQTRKCLARIGNFGCSRGYP